MSNVRLLFAPESVAVADRIAAALAAGGYQAVRGDGPAAAALVVWSSAAGASPAILSAARAALARRVLVPVALGKAPPPPSFEHLWPMDLSGWGGDVHDPRWKFVVDEIDLAVRRGVEIEPAPPPVASRAAPKPPIPVSSVQKAPIEPEGEAPSLEDVFTEPQSYSVGARPRPRIPLAAMAAAFAVIGIASGGAFIAGRQASKSRAMEEIVETPAPVIAFVQPEDQPADDVYLEEPEFLNGPADGPIETAGIDVFGEGDAEVPPATGETPPRSSEPLRDGAPPSMLEIAEPLQPPADAAQSVNAPLPAESADAQADIIAGLAFDATARAEAPPVGLYFRDCVECPDMAEIEPGTLAMDAAADDAAAPVMLRKRIAVAVKETTFEEWALCVSDGVCAARPDAGWGTGKRPVINVSFSDAETYVRWLSQKTGRDYRLPSESEWEYAARGGSSAAFSFGPAIAADKANFDASRPFGGPPGAARGRTLPAASFAPNNFGLYDMHGNVAEWTADCWTGEPQGAVMEASGGLCSARVVKGGAWNDGGADLRAFNREGGPETARRSDIGFRVVRDLP